MVILDTENAEKKIRELDPVKRKALEKKHLGEQIEGYEMTLEDLLSEDYTFALDLLYDLEEDVKAEVDCGRSACNATSIIILKYPDYTTVCPKCGHVIDEYVPLEEDEDEEED